MRFWLPLLLIVGFSEGIYPNVSACYAQQPSEQQQLEKAIELNEQSIAHSNSGDFAKAEQLAREALSIRKELLGDDHPGTAQSLHNLGLLLKARGDYAGARPYLEQSLAITRKAFGEESPDTARSLNSLGYLLSAQGDLTGALSYYEQALAIRKKFLGEDDPYTAESINNVGSVLHERGDYDGARRYYERALTIRRKVLGEEHRNTAVSLNNIGAVLEAQGDYAGARRYFEQSLEITRKLLGEDHPDTARALNNLGTIIQTQGDHAGARPYVEQALEIRKKVLGLEHPHTAASLNNMGFLLRAQEDYDGARPYFEQFLKNCQKVLGEEHPVTATALSNLGGLLHHQGDYAGAVGYCDQALKIRQKTLGNDHPETAASLNNMGSLLHSQGDYAGARPYFEQALTIREKILGEEHPDVANSLNYLGELLQADGSWEEAVKKFDRSRKGSLRFINRTLASMSPQEQAKFLLTQNRALYAALSLGYVNRTETVAVEAAAGWLINGKGVASSALAQRQLLERDSNDPQVKLTVEKLQDIRRRLATVVMSTPRPDQAAARTSMVAELTQQERALSVQVAQAVGGSEPSVDWVELKDVRAAIRPQSVLVNIARTPIRNFKVTGNQPYWQPERYLVWIIPAADQGDVQVIDLGLADQIDRQVEQARQHLTYDGDAEELNKAFSKLSGDLWKPIADKLPAETKSVVLSPDGALWLLPWSALPLDEDRFLIEEYALQYVISGRELVQETQEVSRNKPLLFADPTFNLSPDQTQTAVEAIFRDEQFDWGTTRGLVSQSSLPKVTPLPNTRLEAAAIAPNMEAIADTKPLSYLGEYALETVAKRVRRPRMMVLSTHGFFLPDQEVDLEANEVLSSDTRSAALLTVDGKSIENPLLRCGMLFAGCNQPAAGADDGVLTGMEIVGLDLRGTELVVLSACETGLGDVNSGEGVAGLRQAFQLAGAQNVVATLWTVPDRDSAIIMSDFFESLADGESKSEALRSAQLQRIEKRRQRYGSAHPFFWAAWTVTGGK